MHTHTHLQSSWGAVSPVHHLSDVVPNPGRPGRQLGIGVHEVELVRLMEELLVTQARGKSYDVRVDGTGGGKKSRCTHIYIRTVCMYCPWYYKGVCPQLTLGSPQWGHGCS